MTYRITQKGEFHFIFCICNKELENKEVILAYCELCIDNISRLPIEDKLDTLSELYGYLLEKSDKVAYKLIKLLYEAHSASQRVFRSIIRSNIKTTYRFTKNMVKVASLGLF